MENRIKEINIEKMSPSLSSVNIGEETGERGHSPTLLFLIVLYIRETG